jgi:prepilin-type N-terminal cleavage/methylation domain-containing protein
MRQRGFTLIEVIVGLVILTIVVTTSLAVFVERNRRLQQASETILAYQALANESEYWRRKPYTSLANTTKFDSDHDFLAPLSTSAQPYTTDISVSQIQPGVKNVTMTIRWKQKHEARLEIVRVETGGSTLW